MPRDGLGRQTKVTEPGNSSLDRVWDYTVDKLNRYTSVDGPRRMDVMGFAALGTASLIYSGSSSGLAADRQPTDTGTNAGPYYRALPNWSGTGIVAGVGTLNSVDRSLYLPPKPEALSCDSEGNLIGDGRFTYTYDGENRLIKVEMAASMVSGPGIDGCSAANMYSADSRTVPVPPTFQSNEYSPGQGSAVPRFAFRHFQVRDFHSCHHRLVICRGFLFRFRPTRCSRVGGTGLAVLCSLRRGGDAANIPATRSLFGLPGGNNMDRVCSSRKSAGLVPVVAPLFY